MQINDLTQPVERGVTAVYDRHGYDLKKRQALEAWALRLQDIIQRTNGEGKVIFLVWGT